MIEPGPRTIYAEYGPHEQFQLVLWDEGDHFTLFTKHKPPQQLDDEPPVPPRETVEMLMSHAPLNAIVVDEMGNPLLWDGEWFCRATIADYLPVGIDLDIDRMLEIHALGFTESELTAHLEIAKWSKSEAWGMWETVSDSTRRRKLVDEHVEACRTANDVLGKFRH